MLKSASPSRCSIEPPAFDGTQAPEAQSFLLRRRIIGNSGDEQYVVWASALRATWVTALRQDGMTIAATPGERNNWQTCQAIISHWNDRYVSYRVAR